jgi:hypothetical protein
MVGEREIMVEVLEIISKQFRQEFVVLHSSVILPLP